LDGGPNSSGGNRDAGAIVDAIDLITEARLHRPGCSCDLGRASDNEALAAPLVISLFALLIVRPRRRKK
jgi:hypothetical protein